MMTVSAPTRRSPALPVAVLLADVTCLGIVMPLLASYAAEHHATRDGHRRPGRHLLAAAFSPGPALGTPQRPDRSPTRGADPGLAGTLGSSILFAMADNFVLLALSRVVAGGLGATLNVTQAYAADLTSPERRTRVMGIVGAAFGVGFIIGPTIGGITSGISAAAPGLAATAIATVNLLVALARLPEAPARTARFTAPGAPVDGSRFAVPRSRRPSSRRSPSRSSTWSSRYTPSSRLGSGEAR